MVLAEQPGLLPSGLAAVLVASGPHLAQPVRRDPRVDGVRARLVIGGVAAGFVGVVVLLLPAEGIAEINPLGVGMVVVAELSWAIGSLYQRRAPLAAQPVAGDRDGDGRRRRGARAGRDAHRRAGPHRGRRRSRPRASWPSSYLIIFGSLIAFSAYIWLLNNAAVSTVGTYAYVNPIIAVALGAWLRSEPITPAHAAGGGAHHRLGGGDGQRPPARRAVTGRIGHRERRVTTRRDDGHPPLTVDCSATDGGWACTVLVGDDAAATEHACRRSTARR